MHIWEYNQEITEKFTGYNFTESKSISKISVNIKTGNNMMIHMKKAKWMFSEWSHVWEDIPLDYSIFGMNTIGCEYQRSDTTQT